MIVLMANDDPQLQVPAPVSTAGLIKRRPPWRKIIIAVIIVIIILAGVLWYIIAPSLRNTDSSKNDAAANGSGLVAASVCEPALIDTYNTAVTNSTLTGSSSLETTIKGLKNYRGDVNCDYMLVNYYLAVGDSESAANSLQDLKWAYNNGQNYSVEFSPSAVSVTVLQQSLDTLTAQQKEAQQQRNQPVPSEATK